MTIDLALQDHPAEPPTEPPTEDDNLPEGSFLDDVDDDITLSDGTLEDPRERELLEEEHGHWYEDTNLWVLVAFVVVIALLLRQGVAKRVTGALDARATGIRSQLDEARGLREEAQSLLADYQKRQREAEDEAASIIDQAKADAKALTAEANRKAEESLRRRSRAAEDRIARAEAQAVAEVRGQAAHLSVAAARTIIAERTGPEAQAALTDRAISEVGQRLG